ncbi:MAG: 6-phosphogluconolactonase [Microbacteriaceae bacterium]|nr:6-phosphogluconolactonase [Microbacteriaceae bacterium]MCL2793709.1 6-phosphogluconolactonase [Microbacteriaceae bacterium]
MQLTPQVLDDAAAIGEAVADLIVDRLVAKGTDPFLLGCPSGRTAVPVYAALARRARAGQDLSRLVVVMMDDYLIPNDHGGYRIVDQNASYSCLRFAREEILRPIADAGRAAGTTPPQEIWTADPETPAHFDTRIEAAGGIDLFLLASGDSDGHIAFNQPGTDRGARTHLVELGEATRRDNMGTFPEFTRLDMVPRHGVTVGVDTIARLSASAVMILTGAHKQKAFARITAARAYEPDWPATIVTECQDASILADACAAGIPARA